MGKAGPGTYTFQCVWPWGEDCYGTELTMVTR